MTPLEELRAARELLAASLESAGKPWAATALWAGKSTPRITRSWLMLTRPALTST